MAQPLSFSSNNPFRRKASVPSATADPPGVPPFDIVDSPTSETTPALPPADRFRSQLQALAQLNEPPPVRSFQKPKVVKKVRVQSPPPSSPESSGLPDRSPLVDQDDSESDSSDDIDEQVDPFTYASSTGSTDASDRGDEHQPRPLTRPAPNPFQKTLRDLGSGVTETTQHPGVATGSKATLDVGAFGRLLLTGQIAVSGSSAPYTQHARYPPSPSGDGGSTPDTSSTSRQSITDTLQAVQDTPRTSREISEQEAEDEHRGLISSSRPVSRPAPSTLKKKPPPPSSRHGKLINPGQGGEGGSKQPLSSPAQRMPSVQDTSPSRQRSGTPSDINKPLPPAPHRSPAEEDAESVFDREAAGKVPEPDIASGLNIIMPPRPPTPPNASHATSSAPSATLQQQAPKKPTPPPRRQPHGRSESRITSDPASQQDDTDASLRRCSFDSTRSRSSSVRAHMHGPAPPPPRRPSHQSRASSSFVVPPTPSDPCLVHEPLTIPSPPSISPAPPLMSDRPSSSSSGREARTEAADHPQVATKTLPPPPPPARNASIRAKRPVSVSMPSSDAGLSWRLSRGKEGPTPPPPPRHRGSSRASLEGVGAVGVAAPKMGPMQNAAAVARNGLLDSGGTGTATTASAAVDILADLTALQREVDALRGQYEKAGAAEAAGPAGVGERRTMGQNKG